jgi:hypothetical protein
VIGILVVVVASHCVLAGPALEILEDLAAAERSERLIGGYTLLGIGAAIAGVSALVLVDSGIGIYGVIVGGAVALPGAIALAIPSPAERQLAAVGDTETAAALALEEMAAEARFDRYLSGAFNIGAGIVSLLFPYQYITPYDYVYSAISSFGMAAYDFLFLSREERAYRQYREFVAPDGPSL